jgi:hypothetical protein
MLQLLAMGFDPELAAAALQHSGDDIIAALEWLTGGGDDHAPQ